MRSRILTIALLLAPVLFTKTVQAEPFNYNYAELAYAYLSPDDSDIDDGHGLEALLSWSPAEHFIVEGGYDFMSLGLPGSTSIDTNTFKYGVGAYTDLMDKLDIVGHVGGLSLNAHLNDAPEGFDGDRSQNENGVYVATNLRYQVIDELELEPGVEYTHVDGSTGWFYDLKGLYALNTTWDGVASVGITDESDVLLTAGIRYNFGCEE